jgi:hypothetical protein
MAPERAFVPLGRSSSTETSKHPIHELEQGSTPLPNHEPADFARFRQLVLQFGSSRIRHTHASLDHSLDTFTHRLSEVSEQEWNQLGNRLSRRFDVDTETLADWDQTATAAESIYTGLSAILQALRSSPEPDTIAILVSLFSCLPDDAGNSKLTKVRWR